MRACVGAMPPKTEILGASRRHTLRCVRVVLPIKWLSQTGRRRRQPNGKTSSAPGRLTGGRARTRDAGESRGQDATSRKSHCVGKKAEGSTWRVAFVVCVFVRVLASRVEEECMSGTLQTRAPTQQLSRAAGDLCRRYCSPGKIKDGSPRPCRGKLVLR